MLLQEADIEVNNYVESKKVINTIGAIYLLHSYAGVCHPSGLPLLILWCFNKLRTPCLVY